MLGSALMNIFLISSWVLVFSMNIRVSSYFKLECHISSSQSTQHTHSTLVRQNEEHTARKRVQVHTKL